MNVGLVENGMGCISVLVCLGLVEFMVFGDI